MKMNKIFPILSAAACAVCMTACGVTTYSTEDYINIEVSGLNGEGAARIRVANDFYDLIDADLFDGSGTDMELFQMEVLIDDAVDYSTDDKTDELSNGDKITVNLTADNDRLKAYGIKFDESPLVYVVDGLQEPVELDVWSDLSITYSDIAPNGSAKVEYVGSNEFIKDNVSYHLSSSYGLSNGDEIIVEANCSKTVLDENLYTISQDSKTFTVEGLTEYLQDDHEELDTITDVMSDKIAEIFENSNTFSVCAVSNGGAFFKSGFTLEKYKVLSYTITPCNRFIKNDYYGKNTYGVFYKLKFEVEKTKANSGGSTDGRAVGDIATSDDIYICMYLSNITKNPDGTLEYDVENINHRDYLKDFFDNYIGASFDEVYDNFIGSETVTFSENVE